jgi:hypothetical protein
VPASSDRSGQNRRLMRPMVLIKSGNPMSGTNSPPIRGPECEHIIILPFNSKDFLLLITECHPYNSYQMSMLVPQQSELMHRQLRIQQRDDFHLPNKLKEASGTHLLSQDLSQVRSVEEPIARFFLPVVAKSNRLIHKDTELLLN